MFLPAPTQASMFPRTACGRGEIDHRHPRRRSFCGCERDCVSIVRSAQQRDVMAALAGHFRDQRAGFAAA